MTFSVDIRPALDHIVLTITSGKNKWVFFSFFILWILLLKNKVPQHFTVLWISRGDLQLTRTNYCLF